MNKGIYIASRASISERPAEWRRLRDVEGYLINSTWIDSIDKDTFFLNETEQDRFMSALWSKFADEISRSERLIIYAEPDDFPLKGTLVEVGIAIGNNIPIYIVVPGVEIDKISYRPLGSWIKHPLVKFVNSMEEALFGAVKFK